MMSAARLTRTRVALAIVTPAIVFAAWFLVQLMDYPLLRGNPARWFYLMSLGGFVWLIPEYVAVGRRRPLGVVASVFLPPLIAVGLFLLHEHVLRKVGINWSYASTWILLIPLGTGLLIIARVFRVLAIPLAMAYLPGMWFVLFALLYPFALSRTP